MKPQERSHSIDLLFVLLIFAAFVLTAMLLISMETSEYQRIIGRMQDNDLSRVTTAYLTQKVRQGREAEAITGGFSRHSFSLYPLKDRRRAV